MNSKVKLVLGIVCLVAVIAVSMALYQSLKGNYDPKSSLDSTTESNANEGEDPLAPDFSVTDSRGNKVKLSSFIGKPVVVNFWASWCPPCKGEMPEFEKVWKELGEDIVFMMVNSTDGTRETESKAKAFIAESGYSFPVYYDLTQEASYTYGISSLPTTLFIDKDGILVTGTSGQFDEKTLRKGLDLIFKGKDN